MKKSILLLCCFLVYSFSAINDLQLIETQHFSIFYPKKHEYAAKQAATQLEGYRPYVVSTIGNDLQKTNIIIEDYGTYSNGSANPGTDTIILMTSQPDSNGFIAQNQNWLRMVAVHESIHMAHVTYTRGLEKSLTEVIGNSYTSQGLVPPSLVEGIAVLAESQISPYDGRLNDGYYPAILQSMAKYNELPSPYKMTAFGLGGYPYSPNHTYGACFLDYLNKRFGKDKIKQYFEAQSQNLFGGTLFMFPMLGMDASAYTAFGESYYDLFQDWADDEKKMASSNWKEEGISLTESNGYTKHVLPYKGSVYYFCNSIMDNMPIWKYESNGIFKFNPETKEQVLVKALYSSIEGAMYIKDDWIYYMLPSLKHDVNNSSALGYEHERILYRCNVNTHETQQILKGSIRAFGIENDHSIVYSVDAANDFGSDLYRYQQGNSQKIGNSPELITEIVPVSDNLYVVSKKVDEAWDINLLELKSMKIFPIVHSPWAEMNIQVMDNNLYYTSNPNGQYGGYSLSLTNNKLQKLTNSSYARYAMPLNQLIYYVGLTGKGDELFMASSNPVEMNLEKINATPTLTLPQPILPAEATIDIKMKPSSEAQWNNVSRLFSPYNRLFPTLLSGTDILGDVNYAINYSQDGLDAELNVYAFSPLLLNYSNYNLDGQRRSEANIGWIAFNSLSEGLQNLKGFYTQALDNDNKWLSLRSFWKLPFSDTYLNWTYNLNRNQSNINWKHYQPLNQSLMLNWNGVIANDASTDLFIRGYNTIKVSQTSWVSQLNGSFPLAKMDGGLWNPNIYIQGLYGTVFFDYMQSAYSSWAYGFEGSLETRLFFYIPFIPKLGIALTKEGANTKYFSFEISF